MERDESRELEGRTSANDKMFNRLAEQILSALDEQHVVVIGTSAAGIVLPELAGMLAGIQEARAKVLTRVEVLVEAHPLHPVLTSMPAVGVRAAARILTDVGKNFPTAGHLAFYPGLSPVTWGSGSSLRGDHASRRGNKAPKRVLFLSAFASLKDPCCRAYYDRGKENATTRPSPSDRTGGPGRGV